MKKNRNKIYWVLDDFNFIGVYTPLEDQTTHNVSTIDIVVINRNMIKFECKFPFNKRSEMLSYNVNLIADEHGCSYSGYFTKNEDSDWKGQVSCEMFENKYSYLVYGKWEEDGEIYTWWSIIEKIQ